MAQLYRTISYIQEPQNKPVKGLGERARGKERLNTQRKKAGQPSDHWHPDYGSGSNTSGADIRDLQPSISGTDTPYPSAPRKHTHEYTYTRWKKHNPDLLQDLQQGLSPIPQLHQLFIHLIPTADKS